MKIQKITLIAVYDSYLKSMAHIASFLSGKNIAVEFYISDLISERFIAQSSQGMQHKKISMADLRSGNFSKDSEVFFIGAGSGELCRISSRLPEEKLKVALFPGVTAATVYKAFDARSDADVLLLNNVVDHDKFVKYASDMRIYNCHPFMLGFPYLKKLELKGGDDIVFFDQNFPNMTYSEKAYILDGLIRIAAANPARKVLIKLRNMQSESTAHKGMHRFENIMKRVAARSAVPANLSISVDSVDDVLKTAGLAISISSTAIFEALYNDINSVVLSDFGVRADFGNDLFSGSNIFAGFDEVVANNLPKVNTKWLNDNVTAADDNYDAMLSFMQQRLEMKKQSNNPKLVQLRAKKIMNEIKKKKHIYGGIELQKEMAVRKYRKFRNSPSSFFEDSKNILIKPFAGIFK